jgi:voltage-gated potassium channel
MRDKIFNIMEGNSELWISRLISIVVVTAIIVACVAFILETIPEYNYKYKNTFACIELVVVIIFTIEYTIRWITVRGKLSFMLHPLNIIDLLAILPFYLGLLLPLNADLRIMRIVRLVRVFRIFKLAKYSKSFQLTVLALKDAGFALGALIFLMVLVLILSSTCMYFAEHEGEIACSQANCGGKWLVGVHDAGSPQCPKCHAALQLPPACTHFRSVASTFWWCIVTMTTVGYGDVVPQTAIGKLIAAITMILGILCIALPTGVIATTFSVRYEEMKKQKKAEIVTDTASHKESQEHLLICPHCGQKFSNQT